MHKAIRNVIKYGAIITGISLLGLLCLSWFLPIQTQAVEVAPNGVLQGIEKAQQVNIGEVLARIQDKGARGVNELWLMARAYSLPMLLVSVLLAAVFMLLSIIFGRGMKQAAASIIGVSILAFVLFNYAPQIAGMVLSLVDSVFE